MALGECTAIVAPYYNIGLVVILVFLFIRLLKIRRRGYFSQPWYLLFLAICIFILEELLTILKHAGIISYPAMSNPLFEMVIVALFIYMVLKQREHIAKHY